MVVSHYCITTFDQIPYPKGRVETRKKRIILPPILKKISERKHLLLRVKVHGVSLSRGSCLASSRECQVRPRLSRDSKRMITPFMRVDNYSTRNFATLEPSELGLPFTGPSDFLQYTKNSYLPALGRRQALYRVFPRRKALCFC